MAEPCGKWSGYNRHQLDVTALLDRRRTAYQLLTHNSPHQTGRGGLRAKIPTGCTSISKLAEVSSTGSARLPAVHGRLEQTADLSCLPGLGNPQGVNLTDTQE